VRPVWWKQQRSSRGLEKSGMCELKASLFWYKEGQAMRVDRRGDLHGGRRWFCAWTLRTESGCTQSKKMWKESV
jgi:hypothetical protein